MGDKNAEIKIPSKRIIPGASSSKIKRDSQKGGWVEDLKTAYKVVGAVGITAAAITHPTETKNTVGYIAHHLPVKGVERQVNESLEARYAQLVDLRIKQDKVDVNLIYPNLGGQETTELEQQLVSEKSIVNEHYLTDEAMQNLKSLEPVISQSAREYAVPADLLLGMVIVESSGNQWAFNENKDGVAKGMTQMMPQMAEAHDLSISYADVKDDSYDKFNDADDRYKPELILPATAAELSTAYWRWNDWGLATWEWHAGARNVYAAIAIYVKSEYGEDLPNIVGVDDPDLSMQIAQEYRDKIAQYNINLFRLFKNADVQRQFSGPEWDSTLIYVKRILATTEVYREKTH